VWSELASFMGAASGESLTTTTVRVLQLMGLVLQRQSASATLKHGEAPSDESLALGFSDVRRRLCFLLGLGLRLLGSPVHLLVPSPFSSG
jgi:hypothetical protein